MNEKPPLWFFLDGAASFSLSMLISLIIQGNQIFAEIWGVNFVKELTHQNDGLMASTILLLFPSTAALYGGIQMFFAAKEAVERRARARDERMREQGRAQERRHILDLLEKHGIELPPDAEEYFNGSRPKPGK